MGGGYLLNSMAWLADGWHMSSHALALGLSVAADVFARRLSQDGRFAFGTWKIEVLGGYSSALLLGVVALDLAAQLLHVSNQNVIYALQPAARNRLSAGYMTGYFIGGSLGSLLSARIYPAFGWSGSCAAGTAVAVLALLLWWASQRRLQRA